MIEFLVEFFEPRHNGGVLPPLLAWAAERVAGSFQLDSAVGVLHDIVTVGNDTGSSLQEELGQWVHGRLAAHVAFFVLSCLTVLVWLCACLALLCATFVKERRRRRRRQAEDTGDTVDGGGLAKASRYLLFADMLRRRAKRLRQQRQQRPAAATAPTATASDYTDFGNDVPDGGFAWPDAAPMRVVNFSPKTLQAGDRSLLGHTAASLLLAAVCLSLLAASLATAGNLVTFTSTSYSSGGVRAIATSTVGHVDVFLNRSLAESNATILRISQEALPHVQRMFLAFGQELLDSLMHDFNISTLITELQTFLGSINSTMQTMQMISNSRVSTINELQTVAILIRGRQSELRTLTASICRRLPEAAATCRRVDGRLPQLAVQVNSSRLDTDPAVTIVTLVNRMLNVNISQVQQQIEAAQSALAESLNSISDVVRSLFDSLVAQVAHQFNEAELLLEGVKQQYDAAVADPRLWSAVGLVHASVVALLVLTGCSFAVGCLLGACLVAFLLRHLRIGSRLDRYVGRCDNQLQQQQQQQSPATISLKLQDANNNRRQSATLSGGFGEHWMELEAELRATSLPRQPLPPSAPKLTASPERRRKITKLAAKEVNSFVYCCPNDCSVLLMVVALFGALPLLLGSAFFYFSAEVHVDACRYLATGQGQRVWDSLVDNFTQSHVWPKVEEALRSQEALPISIQQYPSRLLHAVSDQCANSSRSLFDIFGLLHSLNASAILEANATREQFEFGARLLRDLINSTDVKSLIPAELDALKAVLPQMAGVMDGQDYSESIGELSKPLLSLTPQELGRLFQDLRQLVEEARQRDSSDEEATVLKYTVDRLSEKLADSSSLEAALRTLRSHFQHLQDSRILGSLTTKLLEALAAVEAKIVDKKWMLRQVDVRFYSILDQHLPKFAAFLDPLAVSLLRQVGFCDDLSRAYHTVAGDFCSAAIPPINAAAFLLFVTTIFFGALFLLCWLLLLRVRRHQMAVAQFELQQLQPVSSC